jgi:hypothetical protein
MSFYSDASLAMIPSGYKDQKVYSALPITGDGDLTFSRASSATRVASNGLIEKVRTNLQTYSQNFTAAGGWGGDTITATANYGTAPDGTQTSTRLQFSSANYVWQQSVTGINGNLGVFSLYIKGTAGETIQIAYGGTDKLVTIGTGWTRVNTNGTVASSGTININTYGGTARDFEVWGGQTELGDIATDYIATTTTAVSVGPVSGLPRLDYLDSSAPRLLLEPQRTNVVANSEVTSGYSTFGAAFTQNTTTSPQGSVNADTMAGNGASTQIFAATPITFASAGQVTISVFAKANTASAIDINFDGFTGATNTIGIFNLATGTTASSGASIQNYGNGWYRCILTGTIDAGDLSGSLAIDVRPSVASQFWPSAGDANGKSVFVWGFMAEFGAYATSYIPTLGTSVTRVADNATKGSISSLIGQTEGTIFLDFIWGGVPSTVVDSALMSLGYQEYGTSNIAISNYTGALYGRVTVGTTSETISFGAMTIGQRYKAALAYANNDVIFYVNGVSYGILTSVSIPATSALYFTNDYPNNKGINQALLFKTRLSNSDLASLTSL